MPIIVNIGKDPVWKDHRLNSISSPLMPFMRVGGMSEPTLLLFFLIGRN